MIKYNEYTIFFLLKKKKKKKNNTYNLKYYCIKKTVNTEKKFYI